MEFTTFPISTVTVSLTSFNERSGFSLATFRVTEFNHAPFAFFAFRVPAPASGRADLTLWPPVDFAPCAPLRQR
jgi:hypothetical protein